VAREKLDIPNDFFPRLPGARDGRFTRGPANGHPWTRDGKFGVVEETASEGSQLDIDAGMPGSKLGESRRFASGVGDAKTSAHALSPAHHRESSVTKAKNQYFFVMPVHRSLSVRKSVHAQDFARGELARTLGSGRKGRAAGSSVTIESAVIALPEL
jgi:hypothetical protein